MQGRQVPPRQHILRRPVPPRLVVQVQQRPLRLCESPALQWRRQPSWVGSGGLQRWRGVVARGAACNVLPLTPTPPTPTYLRCLRSAARRAAPARSARTASAPHSAPPRRLSATVSPYLFFFFFLSPYPVGALESCREISRPACGSPFTRGCAPRAPSRSSVSSLPASLPRLPAPGACVNPLTSAANCECSGQCTVARVAVHAALDDARPPAGN